MNLITSTFLLLSIPYFLAFFLVRLLTTLLHVPCIVHRCVLHHSILHTYWRPGMGAPMC
ncbi:hypothetical protein L873DRAFT_1820557 [Choiromyces venosus 120613-1]|uniref:Uncharacterized protein n=1 Tax=Choiromyces venosus 120613-1 TaxID=1336337 RepID=A0A3N4IXX5_9PEZI|nr:hypothetical protein L873DRAFT_1820557 [Choiromyces venosus 120613-1]